jgi:hypothetical protein
MNGYIDQVAVYPLYKTNDNIHVPKTNPAPLSALNLSSSNSGYLDKGFLKTRFDTAIRFFQAATVLSGLFAKYTSKLSISLGAKLRPSFERLHKISWLLITHSKRHKYSTSLAYKPCPKY